MRKALRSDPHCQAGRSSVCPCTPPRTNTRPRHAAAPQRIPGSMHWPCHPVATEASSSMSFCSGCPTPWRHGGGLRPVGNHGPPDRLLARAFADSCVLVVISWKNRAIEFSHTTRAAHATRQPGACAYCPAPVCQRQGFVSAQGLGALASRRGLGEAVPAHRRLMAEQVPGVVWGLACRAHASFQLEVPVRGTRVASHAPA